MRKIHIEMLTPQMKLGRPVCIDTNILINAGVSDLSRYRKRLKELGINYLYIEDDASEGIEIEDLITQETRMKCKKNLHKNFNQIGTKFSINTREVSDITESLIDDILIHKNILYNLNEIGGIDDNTLDHSINTTIFSICLGNQLGYNSSRLKELAMGTLLHDVGKTLLNHRILFKPGKLTDEEFEHVRSHALLGYELLSKDSQISEISRQICQSHHERIDGSGYPNGLKGHQLPEFVKIASIVDVYEALTVNRCYHNAITPLKATEILTAEAATKLDFELVSVFIQNIAIYPTGTSVLLSDGRYAIVKEQNTSFPLRPIIRIVETQNGRCVPTEELNLLETLNITVTDSDIKIPVS